jgi:hydrogenase maturation factor
VSCCDRPSDSGSDLELVAGHCITCGDDGVPMRVLRLDAARGLALCADDQGAHHTVETDLVAPVAPGDELLVHAGVALVAL